MSEFTVRISNTLYDTADIKINGKRQKFSKNGRGSYELKVEADGNAEIALTRNHELLSPMWLLWGLLFFFVSCFGIFDVPYRKTSALTCRVNVTPGAGGVVQFTPNLKKDGKGVLVESDNCVVEELENSLDDKIIKKRRKTLRIIKLLLWLALIAAVIVVIVL